MIKMENIITRTDMMRNTHTMNILMMKDSITMMRSMNMNMSMRMNITDIATTIITIITERARQKSTVSALLYITEENLLPKKNLKTGWMLCRKTLSEVKELSGLQKTIMMHICLSRQESRLILPMQDNG